MGSRALPVEHSKPPNKTTNRFQYQERQEGCRGKKVASENSSELKVLYLVVATCAAPHCSALRVIVTKSIEVHA